MSFSMRHIRLGFLFLLACVAIALIGVAEQVYTINQLLTLTETLDPTVKRVAEIAYFVTILGILTSFIIAMFLLWHIGRPIQELIRVCRLVMSGNQSSRVQVQQGAELGLLARSFNLMLDEIEQKNKELLSYQNNLEEKLKQSQNNLVQAAKLTLVGEMASSVAHDLRNPLSVVSGYSEYLTELSQSAQPDLAKIAECSQKIVFATQRVDWLIDRMNQFNHNKGTEKKEFSLVEPVNSSLLFADSKLKKNHVQVNLLCSEALQSAMVHGDLGRIEQVFANLFSNAADAMKDQAQAQLTIDAQFSEGMATILVRDTGSGIAESHLEDIFKPYFTTKKVGEGTGLGLSICKTIVEEHEGEIRVESKVGVGTTFIITFPLLKKAV